MAVQKLGGRMQHNVGAPFDRPDQVGRRQRVVDNERNPRLVGDLGDRLEIGNDAARIGDAFNEDCFGFRCDLGFEAFRLGAVGPLYTPAVFLEGVVELVDRAAVELTRRHDLVAGRKQRVERQMLRRMSRAHRERRNPAFQRGNALLQHVVGGVHDARIDIAEFLETEQVGGVIGIVEHVGRRLIDRRRTGVRGGIGLGARVDAACCKTWFGHDGYSLVR